MELTEGVSKNDGLTDVIDGGNRGDEDGRGNEKSSFVGEASALLSLGLNLKS